MIFFPYKADVQLHRLPLLTSLIAFVCVFVFLEQKSSADKYVEALTSYCTESSQRSMQLIARYLPEEAQSHPCRVLLEIHRADDPQAAISRLADESEPIPFFRTPEDGSRYIASILDEQYRAFAARVPHDLSDRLAYDPKDIRFSTMLTSVVSHGDWGHLIGNLLFFFAFAAAVEVIGGYAFFAGLSVLLAVSTSLAYSYSVAHAADSIPTLGLSGVVMGMIGFVAVVAPTLGIRCFFWFLWFIRRFSIPSLLLAVWYVGWDIYDLNHRDPDSNINYVAHVSGAAAGALVGLCYRYFRRSYLASVLA